MQTELNKDSGHGMRLECFVLSVSSFFILDQADATQSSHHSLVQVHYVLITGKAEVQWNPDTLGPPYSVMYTELHFLIAAITLRNLVIITLLFLLSSVLSL